MTRSEKVILIQENLVLIMNAMHCNRLQDIADLLGVKKQTVSNWIHFKNKIPVPTAIAITVLLHHAFINEGLYMLEMYYLSKKFDLSNIDKFLLLEKSGN